MSIVTVSNNMKAIIYQTSEEGIGEPALIVSRFSDVIEIQQAGDEILLNPETVPELVKVLKEAMKEPEKKK